MEPYLNHPRIVFTRLSPNMIKTPIPYRFPVGLGIGGWILVIKNWAFEEALATIEASVYTCYPKYAFWPNEGWIRWR